MKNLLVKFNFHYTYLIMALGLVITGHFSNLIVFTSLIIIHELGHVMASLAFKYKIDKIIIYPYGGLTKVDKKINTNINNDIVVAITGLLFQTLYFLVVLFLYKNNIIRDYIYNLFYLYHKSMLIFNLFPIIPLDGSKLINLILSKYFSFNIANKLTIIISFISIILFLFCNIFDKNYSMIMVIGILLNNIYKFYKELSYIYNRFLLERYLYNFNYSKYKVVDNKDKMYKNKMHYFRKKSKIIEEKEYLKSFFQKKY